MSFIAQESSSLIQTLNTRPWCFTRVEIRFYSDEPLHLSHSFSDTPFPNLQSQRREAQPNRTRVVSFDLGFNRCDQLARGGRLLLLDQIVEILSLPLDPIAVRFLALVLSFPIKSVLNRGIVKTLIHQAGISIVTIIG